MTSRPPIMPAIEDARSSPSGGPGSPHQGEPVFLAVGKLRRPHGVRGEIIMEVLTDFPERLHQGATLYIGQDHIPLKIRSLRWHNMVMLVAFAGYDNPEKAGELRNLTTYVPAVDCPPLPEGEYYHHQVIGLSVIGEQGEAYGKVTEILATGANDVYVIRAEIGPEILVPAVDEFIRNIDLERGEIVVRMAPGLLPE